MFTGSNRIEPSTWQTTDIPECPKRRKPKLLKIVGDNIAQFVKGKLVLPINKAKST